MEKSTTYAAVWVTLIIGVTIILTALILKWYLIQKTVYEQGYSQQMQPSTSYNVPIWVKKGVAQ